MAQKHTEEFRREAVRIALNSGMSRRQIASDLGVGLSTLNKWIAKDSDTASRTAVDQELVKENERLRRENRILREEREVLKKATAFFAGQKP